MTIFFKPLMIKITAVVVSLISLFSISGGGEEDYYWSQYNSTFTPEAFITDKSYEPLFYSTAYFYGDNQFMDGHSYRFVEDQINEWYDYLNNGITKAKLKLIIGTDSLNKAVSKTCYAIKSNTTNVYSESYNLKNTKIKDFLLFINLAKSIESSTNFTPTWVYESDTYTKRKKLSQNQVKKIEDIYLKTIDPFLKHKYWFLTLKAYYYSDNSSKAIDFFNSTSSTTEKTTSFYRGLSYIAGVHHKNNKFALSNYEYAMVFENCPKLRSEAIFNFKPKETKDFNEALNLAQNNTEKAALWALYGYYADPVEAITNIYNLDAKNKHLDYLLSRALNIEENNLYNTEYKPYIDKSEIKTTKLDPVLYQQVIKIANNKNTANLSMWQTAAGYLEILNGNYSKATTYLNEAQNLTKKDSFAYNQIKLFTVFNEISKVNTINSKTESILLPHLKWLFQLEKDKSKALEKFYYDDKNLKDEFKLRTNFLTNWARNYVSDMYKKQNNVVMAELFTRDRNFYLNNEQLNKMETYFLENKNTEWDQFAQSLYDINLNDIYEFKGIKLAYNNQIDEAIIELKKCKPDNNYLLGNPFNGKIKDCNDCDHAALQKTKYTKLSFLEKVKVIQNNVANGTETFSGNILLGNAHYNMSHYGNARFFYSNPIIDLDGNQMDEDYNTLLLNNQFSEFYYQKALNVAQNDEEKAKATYFLTKIERNNFYGTPAHKPYEIDFIFFKGYKKLIDNYSNTQYYKEVIKECGYFRNFAQ